MIRQEALTGNPNPPEKRNTPFLRGFVTSGQLEFNPVNLIGDSAHGACMSNALHEGLIWSGVENASLSMKLLGAFLTIMGSPE